MQDLYKVITRDEAIERFEAFELPAVIEECEQDGELDGPARREAWNNYTDYLCKDDQISDWQYANWTQPECCERETNICRDIRRELTNSGNRHGQGLVQYSY